MLVVVLPQAALAIPVQQAMLDLTETQTPVLPETAATQELPVMQEVLAVTYQIL